MTGAGDWPSHAHRERDTRKVDRLAQRLRQRRKERPRGPDDGLSPLDRRLKELYPELHTDPVWSAMHET